MLGYSGVVLLEKEEVWSYWSGCGLVRGRMSLRWALGVSKAQVRPSDSLFLLPLDPEIELSATMPASMPTFSSP